MCHVKLAGGIERCRSKETSFCEASLGRLTVLLSETGQGYPLTISPILDAEFYFGWGLGPLV